ncbi:transcription factor bHLH30-like [Malania oleifera]|uniref:transcription factor bHLH30-like n=1 Tax=Malania oleifera TaxID=397392 RepID=UPI0025AE496F|nr:transcription factor bHLH30-like [Malania oleifera]
MLSFPSFSHGLIESCSSKQNDKIEADNQYSSLMTTMKSVLLDGGDGDSSLGSASEECKKKKHSEAERKRRRRHLAHLATLRGLLPEKLTKKDKASLLAEVVRQVRDLKKQAADAAPVAAEHDGDVGGGGGDGSETSWCFPGDADDVTLSYCGEGGEMIKATVCCEDRPGLNGDLARAIRSVGGRAVRMEMATVGGRTKSVVVMQRGRNGGKEEEVEEETEEEEIGRLKRAFKAVVENRVSGTRSRQVWPISKRRNYVN